MSGTKQYVYYLEPSWFPSLLDHELPLDKVLIRNRRYESSREAGCT